jgi:hypothetical protein
MAAPSSGAPTRARTSAGSIGDCTTAVWINALTPRHGRDEGHFVSRAQQLRVERVGAVHRHRRLGRKGVERGAPSPEQCYQITHGGAVGKVHRERAGAEEVAIGGEEEGLDGHRSLGREMAHLPK